ncbi:hypothetical protein ACC754_40650, partial [Rhizobium johnstonii]
QFGLAATQSKQQFVEVAITGSQRKDPIEPGLKSPGCTGIRSSPIGFQGLVKVPDKLSQGVDVFHLAANGIDIFDKDIIRPFAEAG